MFVLFVVVLLCFVGLVWQYDHFVLGRRIWLICFSLVCNVYRSSCTLSLCVFGRLCSVIVTLPRHLYWFISAESVFITSQKNA